MSVMVWGSQNERMFEEEEKKRTNAMNRVHYKMSVGGNISGKDVTALLK